MEVTTTAGLFLSAFLSATLLPGASEATLIALIVKSAEPVAGLAVVATIGNTLGSVVNYACGRFLRHFENRRWFPASAVQVQRAGKGFLRYGVWTLLFAWLPVVGDALTIVAGALRTPFPTFTILVFAGKLVRYVAIALIAANV